MFCLPQTRPTVFLRIKTIKATNAVQMVYSIYFQLKATPYLWTVVYSDLKLSPFQYNFYVLSFS